jgi:hypothetical protein
LVSIDDYRTFFTNKIIIHRSLAKSLQKTKFMDILPNMFGSKVVTRGKVAQTFHAGNNSEFFQPSECNLNTAYLRRPLVIGTLRRSKANAA